MSLSPQNQKVTGSIPGATHKFALMICTVLPLKCVNTCETPKIFQHPENAFGVEKKIKWKNRNKRDCNFQFFFLQNNPVM